MQQQVTPSLNMQDAKNHLKYLAINSRKYHVKAHQENTLKSKINDLEDKNRLLSIKLNDIEQRIKPDIFKEKKLRSKQEIIDEIKNISQIKNHNPKRSKTDIEKVFPSEIFTGIERKHELEKKIEEKLGFQKPIVQQKEQITQLVNKDERLAALSSEKKRERQEELEKKIHRKFLDERLDPLKEKLELIKNEYNRVKRLKAYKDKKKRLSKLKNAIDNLTKKIEDIY